MMNLSWDPTTRGRWLKLAVTVWIVALLAAASAATQPLPSLTRTYLKKPVKTSRDALLRYAGRHKADTSGALALLVVGSHEALNDDYALAIPRLKTAKQRLGTISDYPAYYLAKALYETGRFGEAIKQLQGPVSGSPASPLQASAILLAAQIYLESGGPAQGAKLLRDYLQVVPKPQGLLLLAQNLEAAKDLAAAAAVYQRIYYEYPTTGAAREAATAAGRLRRRLGSRYPPATAPMMFTRVDKLIRAHRHKTARKELQRMTTTLGGPDRDRARVWLGKARYIRGHDSVAYRWLKSLRVASPEADAERLYYLLESARRLNRTSEMSRVLARFQQRYPSSKWRLRALVSAGNYYLLQNRHDRYIPLYEACAEAFPAHPRAAYCDWKVVWSHFIRRQPDAEQLLKRHLEDFPKSRKASTALYFLGRLAEESGNLDKARTYFEEVVREYPNFYYAGRSRERLDGTRLQKADPSAKVKSFLKTIRFPRRRHRKNFTPTEATRLRLRRAGLLFSAGLDQWGESELRFGARTDGQGPILAMELATSASKRKQYGKSIRYIKGLAPGYLSMPIEAAPRSFWELAFPLPYRATIEKYARRRNLDFYFLAALIRQESEFDARAVSRARARGLTQILSSTGHQLSRKLHIRGYRTSWLYRPDVNLNMGTYYLRSLIDELGGHTEAVLASYNAGKSRAKQWLTWAEYREGAEFVETIPFTETRNYVQTVLRNADIYQELYGKKQR